MKRLTLIMAILCGAVLCFSSLAASQPAKAANTQSQVQAGNITILMQDSGTNISMMNLTLAPSITYGSGQAVKFTPPTPGWKLESVLVMATDSWNSSSNQLPNSSPFAIEIRDADLRLLYHFADSQLPYFTNNEGVRLANIEVPAMPLNGDIFICFYGYRSLALAAELENVTGASYIFDKIEGKLYAGVVQIQDNEPLPVNWIIRVAGQQATAE